MIVKPGSIDVTTYFIMRLAADGTRATGLTPADFDLQSTRSGATPAAKVDATLNGNGIGGAHSDNTVIEVDATSSPGKYRIDWSDAPFATGVPEVTLTVKVATAFTEDLRVELISIATQEQVNAIGSGATGGTHVEATYDNTTRDTIDNAAADLKGGGLVGIPVTAHSFITGREITIAGSVAYNGAFEIISQTTDEVVITHAQTAETFGGAETIVASIKGEVFVGTITSGTFADTSAQNGVLHSMDDVGDDINIAYGFNVGGSRQGTLMSIFANVNGNTDEITVKAYNFVSTAWELKGAISGSGGTAFVELDTEFVSRNTGTGSEIGDVFVLFDTVTTTPSSLDVDKCLLTAVGTNVLIGYPNGYEILAAGTSGTEFGVNGTAGNPCPFADAVAMNAVNVLNEFKIHNGETIQLSGVSDKYSLIGETWTLQLNDKSIVHMHASGAEVSGTSTGENAHFHDCDMGICTIAPCNVIDSRFTADTGGGFTMLSAGDYTFHHCGSMVPSNGSPVFTFPASGNTSVNDRAGSGGRQYEGMTAGDLATVEGWGQFIEGTCSGGAVTIRGCLTTSGISNITITDEARFDVDQVGDACWDEVISSSVHNASQSAGKRLRQATALVVANDTAEVSNSPAINQIQLADGESSVDGTFDPGLVGIVAGTGAGQCRLVLEYTGALRLATLNRDWKIAPDATSEYIMLCTDGGLHVNEGLAGGSTSTSITLNSLASSANNVYNGQFVFLTSGPGQDQVGRVTAYNGTTKVATITTATNGWVAGQLPTSTTGYIMIPLLDTVPNLLATHDAKLDTLLTRITSTLFTGITSFAEWLGLIAGKQVGDTTARTELRATGAGSGTFDETTDSNEAKRDRSDIAKSIYRQTRGTTVDASPLVVANGGSGKNNGTRTFLNSGHMARITMDGTITGAKIEYGIQTENITSITFQVWRWTGAGLVFDQVGSDSDVITTEIANSATVEYTFSAANQIKGVQVGDMLGVKLITSGTATSAIGRLIGLDTDDANVQYIDSAVSGDGVDFSANVIAGAKLSIAPRMTSPTGIIFGDSFMATVDAYPTSFLWPAAAAWTDQTPLTLSVAERLRAKDGTLYNVINSAFGGTAASEWVGHLPTYVEPYAPRWAAFSLGNNDIADGRTFVQYQNDIIDIIHALKAADIVPVGCSIMQTSTIRPEAIEWSEWLERYCNHVGVPFVDIRAAAEDFVTPRTRDTSEFGSGNHGGAGNFAAMANLIAENLHERGW